MNNLSSPENSSGTWHELVLNSRRKYSLEKLRELNQLQLSSLKRVLKWVCMDLRFLFQQCTEIYTEIRLFGPSIKREYKISIVKQILQQLYLVFCVRASLKHYRGYLLFKKDRWAAVRQFTYENYPAVMKLVETSFPDEQLLFDDKLKFYRHCLQNDIFTPPVLGVFKDGREIFSRNDPFRFPAEDLFVKKLCGRRGQGINKYKFTQGNYSCSETGALQSDELLQLMREQSRGNNGIIVQKSLQNHQKWHRFTSGALSTCRVLTARSSAGEKITIVAATLRMPVGSTDTDNTSTGGIASAIDIKTGRLGKGIRKEPLHGIFEFDRHPDANQLITGTSVPCWDELTEFAKRAHHTFDTIFVGWDIAVTTDGLALIEGNIGWSVRIMESPHGRALTQTQFPEFYNDWMEKQNR